MSYGKVMYSPVCTSKKPRGQRLFAANQRGRHTPQEWRMLKELFGCCVLCGDRDPYMAKDHIVPISRGGSNAIENLQPLCNRCNTIKGTIRIVDFRPYCDRDWVERYNAVAVPAGCREIKEIVHGPYTDDQAGIPAV